MLYPTELRARTGKTSTYRYEAEAPGTGCSYNVRLGRRGLGHSPTKVHWFDLLYADVCVLTRV